MNKDEIYHIIEWWERWRPEICHSKDFPEVYEKFINAYQPERSKREDLCFCIYCEEEKSKVNIEGFICKQCWNEM